MGKVMCAVSAHPHSFHLLGGPADFPCGICISVPEGSFSQNH